MKVAIGFAYVILTLLLVLVFAIASVQTRLEDRVIELEREVKGE